MTQEKRRWFLFFLSFFPSVYFKPCGLLTRSPCNTCFAPARSAGRRFSHSTSVSLPLCSCRPEALPHLSSGPHSLNGFLKGKKWSKCWFECFCSNVFVGHFLEVGRCVEEKTYCSIYGFDGGSRPSCLPAAGRKWDHEGQFDSIGEREREMSLLPVLLPVMLMFGSSM